jgi:gas vesicle protein
MFTTKERIIVFITGALAGVAAGLLLAPERKMTAGNKLTPTLEGEPEEVDLGGVTTAPLSEISEDASQLEALRNQLATGQS